MAAPDLVTQFLNYGFGPIKDQAIAALTLYAASLAFLVAFSDKVLNIVDATAKVRETVDRSLYAIVFAVSFVFCTFVCLDLSLHMLQLWSPLQQSALTRVQNANAVLNAANSLLIFSAISYLYALYWIFLASLTVTKVRKTKEAAEAEERERNIGAQEDKLVALRAETEALRMKNEAIARFDQSIAPFKQD